MIPTVEGREAHLERCVAAYAENTVGEGVELLVERGHSTCGLAWNAGAARATGEYLHLTADDLEPLLGWNLPAQEAIGRGEIPAPLVYKVRLVDGYPVKEVETSGGEWNRRLDDWERVLGTCVVPFCRLRDWRGNIGPSIETHYYTDNWFTDQCRRAGLEIVLRQNYAFIHHWALQGRGAGTNETDRIHQDRRIYYDLSDALMVGGGG